MTTVFTVAWIVGVAVLACRAVLRDMQYRRSLSVLRRETALAAFRQRNLDKTPWLN